MSVTGLITIAKQYIVQGVISVSLIYIIGYLLIYKKILKGKKSLKDSKYILWGAFLIYIIVVLGATIGNRAGFGYSTNNLELKLFSSYVNAWNSFSMVEWRNIILNIAMFIPLGFMLPLIFEKCKKVYVTYFIGILATVFIESVQLITGTGIFEADDLLNNTVGCMIGYGLVMIGLYIANKSKGTKESKGFSILGLQIPLIITVIGFSTIFITYMNQELGNLDISPNHKLNMSSIEVKSEVDFSNEESKAYVYDTYIGNQDDTLELANNLFETLGVEIDEGQNNEYDETILYYSDDGNYSLWVNYKGLTSSFRYFNDGEHTNKEGIESDRVKELLLEYGISLPEEAEFKEEHGGYTIILDMVKSGDNYFDGTLNCNINEDEVVTNISNNIISHKEYKEFNIISEEEAYNKILEGEFWLMDIENQDNSSILINDISLVYKMDSKGFKQPVYEFNIAGDGDRSIYIPALKK